METEQTLNTHHDVRGNSLSVHNTVSKDSCG